MKKEERGSGRYSKRACLLRLGYYDESHSASAIVSDFAHKTAPLKLAQTVDITGFILLAEALRNGI